MSLRKIRLVLAIIGAILSIALVGVKIHNEIASSRPATVAAPSSAVAPTTPVPQKMTYTLTLSREVVVDDKK